MIMDRRFKKEIDVTLIQRPSGRALLHGSNNILKKQQTFELLSMFRPWKTMAW